MTLVSSANNIGSDMEFIIRRRSFIYIMKIEALELILREFHFAIYPSERKNFVFN